MSESSELPDPTSTEIEATNPTEITPETKPKPEPDPGPEAAKYRRRLRVAEGERDALAGRVEALQRGEIDRQAEASGIRPAALWAAGHELADLLDDEGNVSADLVGQAVTDAVERLGVTQANRHAGALVPREGYAPATTSGSGRTMVEVVQGR